MLRKEGSIGDVWKLSSARAIIAREARQWNVQALEDYFCLGVLFWNSYFILRIPKIEVQRETRTSSTENLKVLDVNAASTAGKPGKAQPEVRGAENGATQMRSNQSPQSVGTGPLTAPLEAKHPSR